MGPILSSDEEIFSLEILRKDVDQGPHGLHRVAQEALEHAGWHRGSGDAPRRHPVSPACIRAQGQFQSLDDEDGGGEGIFWEGGADEE